MLFSIAKLSEKRPGKLHCGDYVDYLRIDEENLIILALADGVGSTACDWKASEIAVKVFINSFIQKVGIEIKKRIELSINDANNVVASEPGTCSGMSATLVIAVWDLNLSRIFYSSIGDSRIYAYTNNNLEKLNKEDTKAIIMRKKDGKPYQTGGSVVIMEGITNAIGKLKTFIVDEKDAIEIDGLVLMSDGVYNYLPNFENILTDVFAKFNFTDESLKRVHFEMGSEQGDDFSILMIRKDVGDFIFDFNSPVPKNIPEYYVALSVLKQINMAITDKNSSDSLRLTNYCIANRINIGGKNIEELIASMKQNNFLHGGTYQNLIALLKFSKT